MKKYPTRKIYVFILEGESDKYALERILQKIYTNRYIYPIVINGDITSDYNIEDKDMLKELWKKISSAISRNKWKKTDIMQIIHIVDTDGAFIPPSSIIQASVDEVTYFNDRIECSNPITISQRNIRKMRRINILNSTPLLENIPYELYYMSCNLDHVLYNEQNLEDHLKTIKADQFSESFVGNERSFVSFIKDKCFGVPASYIESWNYIKKDLHSLERHNNFFLCFNKHNPDCL